MESHAGEEWLVRSRLRQIEHPSKCRFEMKFNFIARTLVYEHAASATVDSTPAGLDYGGWRLATREILESAFQGDPQRIHRFRSYLNAQHTGLLLLRGGDWIAYGWCSNPRGPGPPHLPQLAARFGGYWIFGCHTHEAYRRQGIYKQLLARLVDLSATTKTELLPEIHIDTHAENIPARCAILGSGFQPCGVFSTYRLPTPFGAAHIVSGRWRRDAPHPELARETAKLPVAAISREVSYKNLAG